MNTNLNKEIDVSKYVIRQTNSTMMLMNVYNIVKMNNHLLNKIIYVLIIAVQVIIIMIQQKCNKI